jgi:branched-chain amino acid transport system ATP-binding protein
MPLLETKDLTKKFGAFVAVDQVNLAVSANDIHAIIGPNGAGKTTLFNLLAGALSPTEGRIRFDGADITDRAEHERPYLGISRSYQIINMYDEMTIFENIQTALAVFHLNYYDMLRPLRDQQDVAQMADDIIDRLELTGNRDTVAGSLSHGYRRRLEVGLGLASDPDLILLDEPTAGMDADESDRIMELVIDLSDEMAVVLVEHDIEHVMEVADRISVLERGSVIADGTPDEIQSNQRVIDAYLGDSVYA